SSATGGSTGCTTTAAGAGAGVGGRNPIATAASPAATASPVAARQNGRLFQTPPRLPTEDQPSPVRIRGHTCAEGATGSTCVSHEAKYRFQRSTRAANAGSASIRACACDRSDASSTPSTYSPARTSSLGGVAPASSSLANGSRVFIARGTP